MSLYSFWYTVCIQAPRNSRLGISSLSVRGVRTAEHPAQILMSKRSGHLYMYFFDMILSKILRAQRYKKTPALCGAGVKKALVKLTYLYLRKKKYL
jgi:hypothetical protein